MNNMVLTAKLTAPIDGSRFLYKEAKVATLLESPRKLEALEEIVYYTLANLLLTINVDYTVRCPLFILSKKITEILVLESHSKWNEFWKCLEDSKYPIELQEKAHSMILEWYIVLNK